jgi:GAF domain-containing protein
MADGAATTREDLLRTVAAGTVGAVGDAFLEGLVQAVGEAFGAGVCWISQLDPDRRVARAAACWPADALPAGDEYALEGTPCLLLHERAVVSFASGVAEAFPGDAS